MERLIQSSKVYSYHEYTSEKEFEQVIVDQSPKIFGSRSIYIDIKKRIGDSIITIPDGYVIDCSFVSEPRLYIIENELSSHDPYKHIGSQLLKFAISYKASGRKLKTFLLDHLLASPTLLKKAEDALTKAGYRNIDAFLESLIFEKPVSAIVIIDKSTPELENVLSQLTIGTDILEFQTFSCGHELIHKFTPFNPELIEVSESKYLSPSEIDTIVVPAQEEGFLEEFIKNQRWFSIRISASMLDKIKFIAAYQTAPISSITYYAEVASIEKYNDTNKYIVKFKGSPFKLNPISLDNHKKGVAPQAPRYTSIQTIKKARVLSDIF